MNKLNIYIDGNNLYRSAKELGFEIDYKKFRGWLRQKYDPTAVYLFIGLVPSRTLFYEYLQECGFILVFKQTVSVGRTVKGNCDAELVLKTVLDFYTKAFSSCILVTGDGDFGCLVEFLQNNEALDCIISPDKNKCSILLKNKNTEITFLNEHYHKFSIEIQNEKAPDADVSA
ncbi:MAG: NYN domain-containing protein [Candidatus Yonathbacteria bacterium]|nr:NYN domain-containing protein [Candidatus Yonathbacteria bacterium]